MKQQLRLLQKMAAPQDLINSFREVCRINSQLPAERRADYSTLLQEQCRKFSFHDILPEKWFFRPYGLGENHRREDSAVNGTVS